MIHFEEFLLSIWSILSMTENDLIKFIYQLFDIEKSNDLTVLEINELMTIICNKSSSNLFHLNKTYENRKIKNNDIISLDEFINLIKATPTILFPISEVRDKLRLWSLSIKKWKDISMKKNSVYRDHLFSDIIESLPCKPLCYQEKGFR